MVPPHKLNVNALPLQEWNYIRGLFLADGCSSIVSESGMKGKCKRYLVHFFFNGKNNRELELVHRVAESINKAGLTPQIRTPCCSPNVTEIRVTSIQLFAFLPNKKILASDSHERMRFFEENHLESREGGIPFLAGLLDGDGYCRAIKDRRYFTGLSYWRWVFSQSRYVFLVGYVKKFVESLAPCSVTYRMSHGVATAEILKHGIMALLSAGIANYSWRVAQWLQETAEARKYHTVGQVARMFNVRINTVKNWLNSKGIDYECRIWHYIHDDELEKLKKKLQEEKEKTRRIKSESIKLSEAADILAIPYSTLYRLYKDRELHATLVREGSHRYLLVPKAEIESFRKRLQKPR
nr:hypothetical protein [Candidatus Njordarchaeota archaeon]